MKKGLTETIFIVDSSGSMGPLVDDTIGGFNNLLEEQKNVGGDCKVTFVKFDSLVETVFENVDIEDVEPLTRDTYRCGGWTALYDAIGCTVHSVGQRLAETPEDERPERVLVVIITDGEENVSQEYKNRLSHIKEMIKHQEEKYNWEFVFLGANIDASVVGQSFGIQLDNTMNFTANGDSMMKSMAVLNAKTTSYRCATSYSVKAQESSVL